MHFTLSRGMYYALLISFLLPWGAHAQSADTTIPTASSTTAVVQAGMTVSIGLGGTSYDGGSLSFATSSDPSHGTLVFTSADTLEYSPETGFAGGDSFEYIAIEGATSSAPAIVSISVEAPPKTGAVRISVFEYGSVATSTIIALPPAAAPDALIPADDGQSYPVPARSALAILHDLEGTPDFAMTSITHDPRGLYVKCVSSSSFGPDPVCDFWLYAVNGASPIDGLDAHILQDGDTLYLYAGTLRQSTLDRSSVELGGSVVATIEQFDPVSGRFATTTGFTVGLISIPDPAAYWVYDELATSSADSDGRAIFTPNATGTFQVGIAEDFYFPAATLTVTDPAPASAPPAGGGGGGGGGGISHASLNISSALSFLASRQNATGAFGASDSPLVTDWTAVALGAAGSGDAAERLRSYLLAARPALSSVTDYERHAMALEAMGIDPYAGAGLDYIAPILAAFDGTQIGSPVPHDDIFGIITLTHAGYGAGDDIIAKAAAYAISKQQPDGSWGDPDTTAAAIQALGPLYSLPGVNAALSRAVAYLKSAQQPDGGWQNPDSTSWVLTAINAIREGDPAHADSWPSSLGYYPDDSLAGTQQADGGVRPASEAADTRLWSTGYAIVAASGKSWLSALRSFPRPAAPASESGGTHAGSGSVLGASTSTTPVAATSTNATTAPLIDLPASTSSLPTATTSPRAPEPAPAAQATISHKKAAASSAAPKDKKPAAAIPAAATSTSADTQAPQLLPPPRRGPLGRFWHAIVSFFASLF